jgi:hypothetical protein
MDYKEEIKGIMEENGINGRELSDRLGMSYGYFRCSTQNKGLSSRFWVRCFVIGYEFGKKIATTASGK